jgi:GntR family carbon starvation induced transcriptional regulator
LARPKLDPASGERVTLTSSVYDQIRTDIVSCLLEPGQKLRIEALKTRYGLGTSPIREALNRLSSERLVMQIDQRGFIVAPVSLEDLQELTDSRCLLYEVLLPRSIEQGDAAWEEAIVLAQHRLLRTSWTIGDPPRLNPDARRAHRDFHRSLIAASGVPMLIDMMDTLFDLTDRYRMVSQRSEIPLHRDTAAEHRAMADAVINRRTEEAIRLAQSHIRETSIRVTSQLTKSVQAA